MNPTHSLRGLILSGLLLATTPMACPADETPPAVVHAVAGTVAVLDHYPFPSASSSSVAVPPAHGSIVRNDTGYWVYTASADFAGEDYFAFDRDNFNGTTSLVTALVRNPIPTNVGAHLGIFDIQGIPKGSIRVNFNAGGRATVVMNLGPREYRRKVRMAFNAPTFVNLAPGEPELYAVLSFDSAKDDSLSAAVHLDLGPADPVPLLRPGTPPGESQIGQWNTLLQTPPGEHQQRQIGTAIARISAEGSVRLTGQLPDGSSWSGGSFLAADQTIPLALSLGAPDRASRGKLLGSSPNVVWINPAGIVQFDVLSRKYAPPADGGNVFGTTKSRLLLKFPGVRVPNPRAGETYISGGGIVVTEPDFIELRTPGYVNGASHFTSPSGTVSMQINVRNGTVSGTVRDSASGGALPFRGVIVNNEGGGVVTHPDGHTSNFTFEETLFR